MRVRLLLYFRGTRTYTIGTVNIAIGNAALRFLDFTDK